MRQILDLDRYPLDRPGSTEWERLVASCQADLASDGMYNLDGCVRQEALEHALTEVRPVFAALSFRQERSHNIYFAKDIPGLPADHCALRTAVTTNRTVCADQIPQSVPLWIYEWSPLVGFIAATMQKDSLYPMRDDLARVNVMAYRDGEALSWHFDRSEFTCTLLLQAPEEGGDFVYRTDLRTDEDPNYEGVARLLAGEDPRVKTLGLEAGTLNVFRGKNTAHMVSTVRGELERIIAVFSYFDRPGVVLSREEQLGFYGRTR
jgi:hypothetical protein